MKTQEFIVGSAIRDKHGKVWSVAKPGRHSDVIRLMARELGRNYGDPPMTLGATQGFVTQEGLFVSREEAWRIAVAAKQLLPRAPTDGHGGRLYSEDVW